MKRIVGMAVALAMVLGVTLLSVQPASASCNDDRTNYVRVDVESEEADAGAGAEVSTSETSNYPVSVGYYHFGGGVDVVNCTDRPLDAVTDDPAGTVEDAVGLVILIIESLLPPLP